MPATRAHCLRQDGGGAPSRRAPVAGRSSTAEARGKGGLAPPPGARSRRQTKGRRGGPTAEAPQGGASLLAGLNYGHEGPGVPLSRDRGKTRVEAEGTTLVFPRPEVCGERPRVPYWVGAGARAGEEKGKGPTIRQHLFFEGHRNEGAHKKKVLCPAPFSFFRARRGGNALDEVLAPLLLQKAKGPRQGAT